MTLRILKLRRQADPTLSRVQDNISAGLDSVARAAGTAIAVSFTTGDGGSAYVQLGVSSVNGAQSTFLRLANGGDIANVWSMTPRIVSGRVRLLYVGLDPDTKYTDRVVYS